MNIILFYLGLWSSKLAKAYFTLKGNKNDDRPGILARKFDINFMKKASKPEEVLLITGTNGKSSTTNLINDMYLQLNKKVSCNTSGNNTYAGEAWTLLSANNIFNKPIVDAIIMEADELHSDDTFPQICPTNVIVTNLGRDSMFKNGNPEIPFNSLNKAFDSLKNTTLFLNSDDPLSCFLGKDNKKIYFGVNSLVSNNTSYISDDFLVCPNCNHKVDYEYRNYRHIGRFVCPHCGLKSPKPDYLCTNINNNTLTVKENNDEYNYPLISNAIYQVYNQVAIIAYFRHMGYKPELISTLFTKVKLPQIREEMVSINDIKVFRRALKGQNASAASTVLQSLVKEVGTKQIILMLDEIPDESTIETISWIWDSDYEFLNNDSIKRIIISGKRHLDHKVRLLCANINPNIIFNVEDDNELYDYLIKDVDSIYILYDIMALIRSKNVLNKLKEKLQ